MLIPKSLGRVNVTTPGTPVQLSSTPLRCARIRVSVVSGLTGKMYLGTAGLVGSTSTGVIKELAANSAGGVDDAYEFASLTDSPLLDLSQYWIDAAVGGEGLIVAYWVA